MIKAYGKYLIILPAIEEKKEKSLLILHIKKDQEFSRSEVVSYGSEVKDINKGDIVIYRNYSRNERKIELDGNEYSIIDNEDIVAVLSGDE